MSHISTKRERPSLPHIVAVDLYCGAGGLTHGLSIEGIDVSLAVDSDSSCRYPIEQNSATKFLAQNVEALDSSVIRAEFRRGDFSILAACPPCQPYSTYTQSRRGVVRRNTSRMVRNFVDSVVALQPDLFVLENVRNLSRSSGFQALVSSVEGYSTCWSVVDCARLGIPQTRRRLVWMGSRLGPLCDFEYLNSYVSVRDTIGHLAVLSAGQSDESDSLHTACSLSAKNLARIRCSIPGGSWRDWPESLRLSCHRRPSGATYPSVYGRMAWDGPAPTITTQCFGYGNGRFGHPEQDRAISLREAALLQTFPDGYRFVRQNERPQFAKVGRWIGNAVPVHLARLIASRCIDNISSHIA